MNKRALAAFFGATIAGMSLMSVAARAGVVVAPPTTFDFVFDNGGLTEAPPPVAPFVGSGSLTIASDPGDGTFLLNSLGGFSMSFTFGTDTFSAADIETPLTEVLVVLTATPAGQQLQFSNNTAGGFGTGPYGGSLDLVNSGGAFLTFEPPGYGGGGLNLYQEGPGDPAGNYLALATPLPSTWTMLIVGFAGLGFFAYRGSKSSAAALAAA